MTKAEQPTITQADRDAAAAYWKVSMIGSSMTQKLYKSGEFDSSLIVQAFARHRTTSLAAQDGLVEALEMDELASQIDDLYEAAYNNTCTCNIDENSCRHCGAWEAARRDVRKLLRANISKPAPENLLEAVSGLRANDGSNGTFHAGKCYDFGKQIDAALSAIKGDMS